MYGYHEWLQKFPILCECTITLFKNISKSIMYSRVCKTLSENRFQETHKLHVVNTFHIRDYYTKSVQSKHQSKVRTCTPDINSSQVIDMFSHLLQRYEDS